MIQTEETEPAAITARKAAGRYWRDDGRRLVFARVLSGCEEVRLAPVTYRAAERKGCLAHRIGCVVVAARSIRGCEPRQARFSRRGTSHFDQLTAHNIAAGRRDNVDFASCAAAVFSRKGIGEDSNFLNRSQRQA